jgi:glycosyltransferase involved in cell wall biosynthesis
MTAITPKLTDYAIRLGANSKTTTYLPTASDLDKFYPTKKSNELIKKYNLKISQTVILFAGTLYNFSGLDHLLNYLAENQKKYCHLIFLIVGHGEQDSLLQKIVKNNKLKNVILTGFIDYNDLPKYINIADICINPFEINKITNIIFPSKIYQYLACEKPVIATRLPGLIDLFPDNQGENNIFYFDIKKPAQFFDLADKINQKSIKDLNPSLQDIAKTIEDKLLNLKAK